MTIQDLKNNRNEIISRINEIADNSRMVEIMTGMVRLVEGKMAEANSPVELVDEIVELMGYEKEEKIRLFVDGVEYNNLSDYNSANNRKMNKIR